MTKISLIFSLNPH